MLCESCGVGFPAGYSHLELEFHGWSVPDVLLSGDHARIARWRREQSLLRTWQRRPELLKIAEEKELLTPEDLKFLNQLNNSE